MNRAPLSAKCRVERGVSLLEVIVALVIISTFGVALFVWAAQTSRTAARAADWLERWELESNASALAVSLNPTLRPQGSLETPGHRFEWTSSLLRPGVPHVKHPAGLSPYEVATYAVKVRVFADGASTPTLEIERQVAGYRQARARPTPPGFAPFPATQ